MTKTLTAQILQYQLFVLYGQSFIVLYQKWMNIYNEKAKIK